MQRWATKRRTSIVLVAAVSLLAVLAFHNVSTDVTSEDETYAALILKQAGYDPVQLRSLGRGDFEGEVKAILAIQDAVLTAAPKNKTLPLGTPREPKDVYEHKYGLCFDRSRAIEKVAQWLGFETRHLSAYSVVERSAFLALLTPQTPSHAVSEVKTKKGWMVVDSNSRWIGLDADRNAVSLADIPKSGVTWAKDAPDPINAIFERPFVHIRGLYSRHGHFYPPYTPVPDYNFGQLLSNFDD